jgi:uncharacterized protein YggT (Ycf19 family)
MEAKVLASGPAAEVEVDGLIAEILMDVEPGHKGGSVVLQELGQARIVGGKLAKDGILQHSIEVELAVDTLARQDARPEVRLVLPDHLWENEGTMIPLHGKDWKQGKREEVVCGALSLSLLPFCFCVFLSLASSLSVSFPSPSVSISRSLVSLTAHKKSCIKHHEAEVQTGGGSDFSLMLFFLALTYLGNIHHLVVRRPSTVQQRLANLVRRNTSIGMERAQTALLITLEADIWVQEQVILTVACVFRREETIKRYRFPFQS